LFCYFIDTITTDACVRFDLPVVIKAWRIERAIMLAGVKYHVFGWELQISVSGQGIGGTTVMRPLESRPYGSKYCS
jgi:hypothetical protein